MIRASSGRRSLMLAAFGLLGACTTLGGNVKGNFSCQAPDGLCAPTSAIDDRALALISGDNDINGPKAPILSAASARVGAPSGERGNERVLRIVFPAYVDAAGRLHEAAAVRAVVMTGVWRPATDVAGPLVPDTSLAAAVAEPAITTIPVPGDAAGAAAAGPDPAVVAAARARLDPAMAIRADVERRLKRPAPKAPLGRVPSPAKGLPQTTDAVPQPTSPASVTTVKAGSFPAPGEDR